MVKIPSLSGRDIVKILEKIGYRKIRQRGSNIRLSAPKRKSVTVPDYGEIDQSLIRKILRDADLSADQFRKLAAEE